MLLAERVSRSRTQASGLVKRNTFIIIAAVILAMLFQFMYFMISMPSEAGLAYQCGLLIAEGKTPYIDFFEVSAPGLMYINAIPAAVSKLIPAVHPIVIYHLFLVALIAGSCFLCALILFRQRLREQAHAPFFVIGFALLNLLMIKEAGQRENLFLLFYMPFFVCRWLTWTNHKSERRLSLAAGISGGIAACLDPLCLFSVMTMEIFFLTSKLKFSPFRSTEAATALAVVALFFLHFAFFPSEYTNLYFNWALPLVLCDYRMWDDRLFWVYKTPDLRNEIYIMILIIVVALGLRRWCSLIPPCIGLCMLGLGLFVIAGKTMTYQALPMFYGAGLAAFLVLSVLLNHLVRWRNIKLSFLKPAVAAGVTVLCLAGFLAFKIHGAKDVQTIDMATFGYSGTTHIEDPSTFATILMRDTNVNDSVLILNDRVRPAYPLLVQYKRKPAAHLLTGFPLRMSRLLIDTDMERAQAFAGTQYKMYEQLIKDIEAKPKLLMIERESLGDVLKDHRVMETIDSLYQEICYAEWPDTESDRAFDYFAFRTPLSVYKLKDVPVDPAAAALPAPAAPVDPAAATLPAPAAPAAPAAAPAPTADPPAPPTVP